MKKHFNKKLVTVGIITGEKLFTIGNLLGASSAFDIIA